MYSTAASAPEAFQMLLQRLSKHPSPNWLATATAMTGSPRPNRELTVSAGLMTLRGALGLVPQERRILAAELWGAVPETTLWLGPASLHRQPALEAQLLKSRVMYMGFNWE